MTSSTLATSFPGMSILEQTPSVLRNLLKNATREEFDWQPSPSRWSISMVLAHLANVEVRGFTSRFTAIVAQDNPRLAVYDQTDLFQDGRKFDGVAELDTFERARLETLAWLRPLPDSVVTRTGRHEQIGVISFGQLLHELAFHDLGHIRQIIELYRSRVFYPRMGAFQDYYKINP
jgi:hypothetical protein